MKKESFFVKSINDANIIMCFLPTDFTTGDKTRLLDLSILKQMMVNSSPFSLDLEDLKGSRIYLKEEKGLTDISKIITDLQFDFMSRGDFRILLGYDHSTTILGERAFYSKCLKDNKVPVILHLGAHINFENAKEKSVISSESVISRALDYGYDRENILLLGPRATSLESNDNLKKYPQIDCFKTNDILKLGIQGMVSYIANKYKDKKYEIYLSYNVDLNDSSFVPEALKPEAFGLTSLETLALIEGLISELNIQCFDCVGFDMKKFNNSITMNLTKKTVKEILSLIMHLK